MNTEKNHDSYDSVMAQLEPPAVESFLDRGLAIKIWPENVSANESFLEQLYQRRELNDYLDDVVSRLPRPDISLNEAIEQGRVTEGQATKLYLSLANLLIDYPDYNRIVLYIPFEFLPGSYQHHSESDLQKAGSRFKKAYMDAWRSLLTVHDVRANFVDGDVLEKDRNSENLPRVVKAAHLVPRLIEKDFLEVSDVIRLIEESNDQLLKKDLIDTLPVAADLGLITQKDIEDMQNSKEELLIEAAESIASNAAVNEREVRPAPEAIIPSLIEEELKAEFFRIESERYGEISDRRKRWLKDKKRQEAIDLAGEKIGAVILENNLDDRAIKELLFLENSKEAFVDGVGRAIEFTALKDLGKAQDLYARYRQDLLMLWKEADEEMNRLLSKTFRRLNNLGVVGNGQLEELNISTPKLSGRLSENLASVDEVSDIRRMVFSLDENSELSKLIYPVALVYGSNLKGYGERDTDIDTAIFVRPGISLAERESLQELLKKHFDYKKIGGQVIEFWLEERGDDLAVHDFAEPDCLFGEGRFVHILFGAAWIGKESVVKGLREKLLVPYLHNAVEKRSDVEARSVYLGDMECDILQYRLMHRGYEYFYPSVGGLLTPNSDRIDGDSVFWDSGYRQLATKLFVSRVFLPKI